MKLLLVALVGIVTSSCQSPVHKNDPVAMKPNTHHGWAIFTGPKRTVVDVNDQNSIKRGQRLFATHCTRCHGTGATGDGPDGKSLVAKPANLKAFSRSHTNYYIVFQVNEGKGEMPQWKDFLTTQEAWDLSNYIQSLRGQ